jgi:hypothetical protein
MAAPVEESTVVATPTPASSAPKPTTSVGRTLVCAHSAANRPIAIAATKTAYPAAASACVNPRRSARKIVNQSLAAPSMNAPSNASAASATNARDSRGRSRGWTFSVLNFPVAGQHSAMASTATIVH